MHALQRAIVATVIAAGVAAAAAQGFAQSQDQYPTKPVRLIVGLAAGGGVDTTARALAQRLTEAWGRPVIVDNRPGATGAIALDLTAKSAPDGYTICMITGATTINSAVTPKLPYDLTKDLAAVSQVSTSYYVVFQSSSLPGKSIKELVAYAKANPGKVNYGSAGTAGSQHLAWERFGHMTGIKLVHVPYKGAAAAITAMLAGEVQVAMSALINVRPHLSSGRLRALAITAKERSPSVPELPTVAEAGVPDYEANQWIGVVTGAKVSPAIVRKLNAGIADALKSPDVVQRLGADGSTAASSSPEEFGALIRSDIAKWRKLVKDAKLGLNLTTLGFKPRA
ncbi:MAG: tripartite tricarboxylate transporter substrate binding protein [Betaproteobacteria bacterium]|nr:tripartite tricarboxylate transporter substrate binding protein [Betaproteobacteria bacterium]MBI2290281.1 tripartite tricarboxylate transporter substrate binding protein [Betaproteobacteria bacterium]MBI3057410.1 tripartite tricarboxylate transporter substrate binding protein [Betaproteobacteria bacterium]